jgi:hypothetical protein
VTLRAVSELLDELDLHYRLNWIATDFQMKNKQASAFIMDEVI